MRARSLGRSATRSRRRITLIVVLVAAASLVAVADGRLKSAARAGESARSAIPGAPGPVKSKGSFTDSAKRQVGDAYAKLPLGFVPNSGQTDAHVRYTAQAAGASFFFTPRNAVFAFTEGKRGVALQLSFLGANRSPVIEGARKQPGTVNYLTGNDSARWQTQLPTYGEVVYRDLWPGIDLAFRGQAGKLKYEFRLAPGADVSDIRLGYRGAERLSLGRAGDLRIHTALGVLRDSRPATYQVADGRRVRAKSSYAAAGRRSYGFTVGDYDRRHPLIIDPGLMYSTYLGGSMDDNAYAIAVDASGSAYVTGYTGSTNFPTTPGAFDTSDNPFEDAFVTKLSATGSALDYSTYLGGSMGDFGQNIAVDAAGSAYVIGYTGSSDFPATPGAFDTSPNGSADAFVTKLNATGSALLYSTFLGGAASELGYGITVDAGGNAYATGETSSSGFPTTPGAFDTSQNGSVDAFVTKLNATGSALVYSTFLGGSSADYGLGVAVDVAGSLYVSGQTSSSNFPTTPAAFDTSSNGSDDAFVTKLNPTGAALDYSTYLGGSSGDIGGDVAFDAGGSAYVTGYTLSTNFPTTPGAFDTSHNGSYDAFVTKLSATGSALAYSTYLGGSTVDITDGIALDAGGNAHVAGYTDSTDFPTTPGAFDTSHNGSFDAVVTKLNASGSALLYSTYLGGSSLDFGLNIALDAGGSAYVTGWTSSTDFPTTPGAFDTTQNGGGDAFVTKLATAAIPATVTLSPAADTNPVGTNHTVTAFVEDNGGNPVADVVVRFTVTGSITTSGQCTTDVNGQCSFSYTGPALPGADLISGCADSDGSGTIEADEPCGEATKAWMLPATTPGQVTGGGQVPGTSEDVAFGFTAKTTNKGGLSGSCSVVDPATDKHIQCRDVTALVVSGTHATVFGNATVDGADTTYRIDVDDFAEPGAGQDTFTIVTGSGYTAGGTLTQGNIQIHK